MNITGEGTVTIHVNVLVCHNLGWNMTSRFKTNTLQTFSDSGYISIERNIIVRKWGLCNLYNDFYYRTFSYWIWLVFLIVSIFASHLRICHLYEDVVIIGEGLHPFIMVISEDPWHSNILPTAVSTCFYVLDRSLLGFEH